MAELLAKIESIITSFSWSQLGFASWFWLSIAIWVLLSFVVGRWAEGRGRNGFLLFFVSLLLSPLIGALLLLALPKNSTLLRDEERLLRSGNHKRCHVCDEIVKANALKCKHCSLIFDQAAVEQQRIEEGHMRRCDSCAEVIKAQAIKCRFCGYLAPLG